ncbi:Peptidyl-prolyl cis-trans isomerase FKBP2 [Cryptotermes secundus]|uniref:peptidylprolyl isomerase n=1 Tax=Cryptotermes secundus TaxID=105785 RepID=A0A2J7QT20_9NEOP|nr:Peptidyl-prolyl cis-trans isomerase FKBP2 [Cryptotermes secundus]
MREELVAETEATREETRAIQERMEATRTETKTIACQELEAHLLEEKPDPVDKKPEAEQQEELPVDDVAVIPGTLEDGTEFDSSYNRGEPLTFTLGSGQVIKGWDQGLMGMCEGEKRKLVVPSELGYGTSGAPPKIPGDATLIFEVELVKIDNKDEF